MVAPDRTQPDPRDWELAPPETRHEPLALVFHEPMDRALLERLLWVVDAGGRIVAGTVSISDRDRRWVFAPRAFWRPGRYELCIDPGLEDLAGNTLRRAFETPVTSAVGAAQVAEEIRLPFRVGAGSD